MNPIFTFYLIGCFVSLIISLYDLYTFEKTASAEEKRKAQYGIISSLTLCSWFTVALYIYRSFKKQNNEN